MRKIIIQPARKLNFYWVIVLERKSFYFLNWWKEVSLKEYDEETAFSKSAEIISQYDIQSGDVHDWSGDGFDMNILKKAS